MKLTTSVLAVRWVSQASMVAGHDDDSNKKSAAPFNFSTNFVSKTHLRGADEDNALLVAAESNTDEASVQVSLSQSTAAEWQEAHNTRRKTYHRDYGVSYISLKWSLGLKDLAQEWATELAKDCNIRVDEKAEYGVNIQGYRGSGGAPTAENSLKTWESKIDKGYPTNGAMTQVLWRPTEYVGCGSASSLTDNCSYSVCYYAKPGNCNMGSYQGDKWETPTYADDSGCIPKCPPEGC